MLTNLRHRVTLQTPTRTTISGGAFTVTWTTASTVWADVQTQNTNETYAQEKSQQYTIHKVVMRDRPIDNTYRIIWNDRTLHIETVSDPTNRDRMIHLMCREEVNN